MSIISTGNSKLSNSATNNGTGSSQSSSSTDLIIRVGRLAALSSLVGIGGMASVSYLSSKGEPDALATSPADAPPQTTQQIMPFFSGIGRASSAVANSLADLVAPTGDPVSTAGPEEDSDRISLGMSEKDLVDSSEDLSFAVVEPTLVKSLKLGPWVTASDKDLSPLIRFNRLVGFSIAGGDNLTGDFLDYLRGAPLWQLSLENLPKFNGDNLKFLSGCDRMERVNIANCTLNGDHLDYLSELPGLNSLVLDGTGIALQDINRRLTNPSLKDMIVRGLDSVSQDDLNKVQEWVDFVAERSFTIEYPDGSSITLLHKSSPREYQAIIQTHD